MLVLKALINLLFNYFLLIFNLPKNINNAGFINFETSKFKYIAENPFSLIVNNPF